VRRKKGPISGRGKTETYLKKAGPRRLERGASSERAKTKGKKQLTKKREE